MCPVKEINKNHKDLLGQGDFIANTSRFFKEVRRRKGKSMTLLNCLTNFTQKIKNASQL
jgi:hypothetical protein